MDRWGWAAGAVATGAAVVAFGHLSHFTWWGGAQFYFLCLLNAIGCGDRFVLAYVYQSVVIIAGVVAMSARGCSLLRAAAEEWSLAYLPLNFAVHFLPSLVAVALAPHTPPVALAVQIVFGALTFVLYAATHDSPHTYGCNVPVGLAPMAVLAATVGLLLPTPLRLLKAIVWRR